MNNLRNPRASFSGMPTGAGAWRRVLRAVLAVVVLLSAPLPSQGTGPVLQLRGGHAGSQAVGKGHSRRARKRRYWKPVAGGIQGDGDDEARGDSACPVAGAAGSHAPKRERKMLAEGVQVRAVCEARASSPARAVRGAVATRGRAQAHICWYWLVLTARPRKRPLSRGSS